MSISTVDDLGSVDMRVHNAARGRDLPCDVQIMRDLLSADELRHAIRAPLPPQGARPTVVAARNPPCPPASRRARPPRTGDNSSRPRVARSRGGSLRRSPKWARAARWRQRSRRGASACGHYAPTGGGPGVTRRLGIAWDDVHARNPRVVYGSISGFGQTGPYAHRPGFDQIAQGFSGLMSVTGLAGQGPVRAGTAVAERSASSGDRPCVKRGEWRVWLISCCT